MPGGQSESSSFFKGRGELDESGFFSGAASGKGGLDLERSTGRLLFMLVALAAVVPPGVGTVCAGFDARSAPLSPGKKLWWLCC